MKLNCIRLYVILIISFYQILLVVSELYPKAYMNFEERANSDGYPVEVHEVVTEDDYILTMYRIPHGLEEPEDKPKNKSAILFMHGMGGWPTSFVFLGKDYAPAYYYANKSFDVWLCCVRGDDCQDSRKHKRYDWNKDDEYWNYSLHEIGFYDASACTDHVIKITGQQKIFSIGHSAGGAELLIMTAERPEYNEKIKILANYGQASFLKYFDYPFISFSAAIVDMFKNRIKGAEVNELISYQLQAFVRSFARIVCNDPKYKKILCHNIIPGLLGSHTTNLIDEDIVEQQQLFDSIPRISLRQIMQYADNLNKGDFRQYDWGPKKNKEIYGQKLPPSYNLSQCTCLMAFFYGTTDSFSMPEDNWLTMEDMPNVIFDYEISPRFAHLDFIFAKNATFMVYEPTVQLFKDYDKGIIPPRITKKRTANNYYV